MINQRENTPPMEIRREEIPD